LGSYVVVEGRGEVLAVESLLRRVAARCERPDVFWKVASRCNALKQRASLIEQCERLRARGDCERALLLQDDEDGCPRDDAPAMGRWVRELALPFPVAVVLFYREYETLFLPCLHLMAGKALQGQGGAELAPLRDDAAFHGDPESARDAKKAVNRFLPPRRPYKPSTHQLALTRLLDLDALAGSGLPCYGSLERAMRFVLTSPDGVYPPAPGIEPRP